MDIYKITFEYDSNVDLNIGKIKSLKDLVSLKDIENEVRSMLNINHWRTSVYCTMSVVSVDIYNIGEFDKICLMVRRNNTIESVLKLN